MAFHSKSSLKPACRGLCTAVVLLLACGTLIGKAGDTAYLKTKVDPGRAGVFVDGKYVGPAANFKIGRKYALPPESTKSSWWTRAMRSSPRRWTSRRARPWLWPRR